MFDLYQFDQQILSKGYQYIIGIDEAGRGPLAGPVVAAAVCLRSADFSVKIQDSKKMTASQRDKAFVEIFDNAYIGVGVMNELVIDRFNILQATFLAMNSAVIKMIFQLKKEQGDVILDRKTVCLLVDGNRFFSKVSYSYETIVKGDTKSLSIACASVIAKVIRDRILEKYHQIFPEYGFDHHKGYPTAAHRQALKKYGVAFIHRKTFRTVRETMNLFI
jgi:ribonuclease HII